MSTVIPYKLSAKTTMLLIMRLQAFEIMEHYFVTFSISASWKGKRLTTSLYSSSVSTGMGLQLSDSKISLQKKKQTHTVLCFEHLCFTNVIFVMKNTVETRCTYKTQDIFSCCFDNKSDYLTFWSISGYFFHML